MGRGEGWVEVPCFPLSPWLGVWTATWLDTTQVFTQTRFWPTLCKIKLVSISWRDKN